MKNLKLFGLCAILVAQLSTNILYSQCDNRDTITYYLNGSIQSIEHYCGSTLNGPYASYFRNGNLQSYIIFEMGIKTQFQVNFNENGTVEFYCEFLDGKRNYASYYDENGNITMEEMYFEGKKIETIHYHKGKKIIGYPISIEEFEKLKKQP